jgi:hypothetical protein
MRHHAFRVLSALLALSVIVAVSQPASAAIVRNKAAAKATATTQPANCASPCDVAVPPKCCYKPCITYHEAGCRSKCCASGPKIQMILRVQDPKSCCTVDVPVCVPACCTGTPCVSTRCALFCRGVVWYDWDCGFSVKVVFKHSGDLAVTYVN